MNFGCSLIFIFLHSSFIILSINFWKWFFETLSPFKLCHFCMNFHTVSCFDHGYSNKHLWSSSFEFYHPFMNFHISNSNFFKEILFILNCHKIDLCHIHCMWAEEKWLICKFFNNSWHVLMGDSMKCEQVTCKYLSNVLGVIILVIILKW